MPASLTHGKFAASQHTGEFAVTSHSQSLVAIEEKFRKTNAKNKLTKKQNQRKNKNDNQLTIS
jgi:hypothetical protein